MLTHSSAFANPSEYPISTTFLSIDSRWPTLKSSRVSNQLLWSTWQLKRRMIAPDPSYNIDQNEWQPLASLSMNFKTAETKYSAFGHELTNCNFAIRHFRFFFGVEHSTKFPKSQHTPINNLTIYLCGYSAYFVWYSIHYIDLLVSKVNKA